MEIAHALSPEVPFVFVSGTIGEETAIESLRNGATDYILKDHLPRLAPAVRRALEEAEERSLNRRLQHRLREAGRLEAVSTLSNGIAHDFNNILTIILGHTSLLMTESTNPDRVLEIGETISNAAKRASEVVQQLLVFARKSEGHAIATDLNRRVQEVVSQVKKSCPPKVRISFQSGRDLPEIMADPNQLDRILSNLLTNALDSMPTGGTISLTTSVVEAKDLPDSVPEIASDAFVCLEVEDSGIGMDANTRQHIFEPFYTTKDRGRGTGLGLPVVYGLMQAHHGWINVESEPNQGTKFLLYFPIAPASPRKSYPSLHGDPSLNGIETVLLVEDETDVSFFLETVLQSYGYTVLVAHDHDQALAVFQQRIDDIQLIFSDIGLPKVDGIRTCRELKNLKPTLKVILSSGYAPRDFHARMEELGVDAFLPKPYGTDDLLRTVRRVFDGPEPA